MRLPPPSRLELAAHCLHPFTSGLSWPDEEDNRFAAFGIAGHELFAAIAMDQPLTAETAAEPHGLGAEDVARLKVLGDHVAELLGEERTRWDRYEVELGLAYDVATGRARRRADRRDRRRGELIGILDLVAIEGTALLVRDWKTGRQKYTADAKNNLQVRMYARAAATFFGAAHVRVELAHVDEDGVRLDEAVFDDFDLDEIGEELRDLMARLSRGPSAPVPGPWCTEQHCPLRGVCSATRTALADIYPLERPFTTDILSDEHAAWMLERLPGAQAALDAVQAAVDARARKSPIALGDGRVYGLQEHASETVSLESDGAEDVLREVLAEDADAAIEVKRSATKGSVREAARTRATRLGLKRGGIKRLSQEVFAKLRGIGAMRLSRWTKLEAFVPGAAALESGEQETTAEEGAGS